MNSISINNMELLRMNNRNNWISKTLPKLRHRALNLATIINVPTQDFLNLIKILKSEGWDIVDNYYNCGISDHYSKIKLKHRYNSAKLTLEWNNKEGGRIEGAEGVVRNIAYSHNFVAADARRWVQKDSLAS
jgi:hypothetical protein